MMKSMFPKSAHNAFIGMCDNFDVERNGEIIVHDAKGFFCSNKYPDSIQFMGDYDITEEDYLIHHPSQKRYFVDNVKPITDSDFIIHYQTEYQRKLASKQKPMINIGTIAGNAIVGSQHNATISIGASFEEIHSYISKAKDIDENEKARLEKFTNAIEAVIDNDMQITKGTFAKYSDLLENHSPLIAAIAQPLMTWLLGK